jgi:hypothetical protein
MRSGRFKEQENVLRQEPGHDSSAPQPVAQTLYRLQKMYKMYTANIPHASLTVS